MNEAGASKEKIKQAIIDAGAVRNDAKTIIENYGLKTLGATEKIDQEIPVENTTRIKELVSIAAACAINTTSNSERHITASKTVGITEDKNIHIMITDTGKGIPTEQTHRLFNPDFTTKVVHVKAGFGLFTSYNIIQKHQDHIKVHSTISSGTTVTVILPIQSDTIFSEREVFHAI